MQTPNERLRADRMVFYADDVQRLDRELDGFLELSRARSALLIDTEGHMITRRGEVPSESLESLAALVAGSFAATHQVAQLLGGVLGFAAREFEERRGCHIQFIDLMLGKVANSQFSWTVLRARQWRQTPGKKAPASGSGKSGVR